MFHQANIAIRML